MYLNIFEIQILYAFVSLALDIRISLSHENLCNDCQGCSCLKLSSKVYILKSDFHSILHDTTLGGMLGFGTLESLDGTVMPTASGSK